MDLKILMTSFWMIFLAEIGDKTQLATLAFASGSDSRFSVFLGASLALVLTSAIAVLLGDAFSRVVDPGTLHVIAGAGFVVIGVIMLVGEFR